MKPLFNMDEQKKVAATHKTEIKCIKCGKSGFADEDYCPHCGARYPLKAVIVDFDMRFSSMVLFMVKWTIAAIPAFIILFGIAAMCAAILSIIGIPFSRR